MIEVDTFLDNLKICYCIYLIGMLLLGIFNSISVIEMSLEKKQYKRWVVMQFVILGYLMVMSFSQYDIKKALEQKVSPFYSASLGSIQPALKKLLERGLVTVEQQMHNGRIRNLYTITDAGRVYFRNTMLEEIPEKKFEDIVSIRLYFLGTLAIEDRLQCLKMMKRISDTISTEYVQYEKLLEQYISGESDPLKYYSLKTLEIAIQWLKIIDSELTTLLAEVEQELAVKKEESNATSSTGTKQDLQ